MECPKCHKKNLSVTNIRNTTDNGRRRRRKCNNCNHKFSTTEYTNDNLKEIKLLQKTLTKIKMEISRKETKTK